MAVPGKTLTEVFINRVAKSPDAVALKAKVGSEWKAWTFAEFSADARNIAGGLISLGVNKGDYVGLLSTNRPEWNVTDVAILLAGAIAVPVYVTNSASQVSYILGHSECRVAIVENQHQLDKILAHADQLPNLLKVVVITGEGAGSNETVISLDDLKKLGVDHAGAHPGSVDERIAMIDPNDTATLVYTAGTTGPPKGVILSHQNFAWTLQCLGEVLPLGECEHRLLCYLPLSHIFERLASDWGGIKFGFEIWFCESTDKILEYLKECEPTFFIGVPRIYEKFYGGVNAKYAVHEKKEVIKKALDASLERVDVLQAGTSVSLPLKVKHTLFDKLVFSKTREELGMGHVKFAITAAAPITADVMRFIHALGIDLIEAYGQTEVNGPTAVTRPGRARFGSVGPVIPGMELRFDADGEILVKGPNVFRGYHKEPEETAAVMTEDGFMRTGDVGELDAHGYLKITDRKKDIIITAGGKNVAPQEIEGRLKVHALVSQAVVIGDQRPFLTALLTLDPDAGLKWAAAQGVTAGDSEALSRDPAVLGELESWVGKVNAELNNVEQIKKWTVLPLDFTQEAEEITPKLSVRRKIVLAKYQEQVEAMYSR
ncbi:MAG: AMP-dependent synthetase/ligase [Actinomycetota bacterium]